jgi:hypothetical protein
MERFIAPLNGFPWLVLLEDDKPLENHCPLPLQHCIQEHSGIYIFFLDKSIIF